MMPTSDARERLRFGDFDLDVAAYELRHERRPVRIERQPMDLLILLVERRGQLVSRAEIIDRLWGKDVFVDVDTGVNTAISKVRQALRDSPDVPSCVETIPGKGYRFIAPVEVISGPGGTPPQSKPVEPPHPGSPMGVTEGEPSSQRSMRSSRARVATGLLAVALLAAFVAWASRGGEGGAAPRITLAVLPFENLSRDPEREYLADGLAEDTIASLGQIDPEHLAVIGRTTMMAYKRTSKSLAEIGRELRVDYVVESSLQAEGDRVRVTSRLIRAADQAQVWSASYDREPTSLLALQQELSAAIVEQVRSRLSPDSLSLLGRRQTRNADAYDAYLRGRYLENRRTPQTSAGALQQYGRAIALDPRYALAWSGLASTYAASAVNGDARPLEVGTRARDAAAQAVRANPDLAEAQMAVGYINWLFDWEWRAADAALRRATQLDPSSGRAYRALGHALSQSGRHAEAEAAMRRTRELDPLEPMSHALSSQVAFQARDYSAAVEHARRPVLVDSQLWIGYMQLGQAYEQIGKTDLALEALADAARLSGGNSKAISLRGYLLAKTGRPNEARAVLNTLEALSRERYVPPYAMALVHAGLGQREAVFEWLDLAYVAHDIHLIYLPVDPKWDPYRADPRFAALLARCGFTP